MNEVQTVERLPPLLTVVHRTYHLAMSCITVYVKCRTVFVVKPFCASRDVRAAFRPAHHPNSAFRAPSPCTALPPWGCSHGLEYVVRNRRSSQTRCVDECVGTLQKKQKRKLLEFVATPRLWIQTSVPRRLGGNGRSRDHPPSPRCGRLRLPSCRER